MAHLVLAIPAFRDFVRWRAALLCRISARPLSRVAGEVEERKDAAQFGTPLAETDIYWESVAKKMLWSQLDEHISLTA